MAKRYKLKKNALLSSRTYPFIALFLLLWIAGNMGLLQPVFAQANLDSSNEKESAYSIKVIYPGHAGEKIILGHYYDYMVMGDVEATLDEQSTCEFTGISPLQGGLYTFIVNGETVPGDFVVDKDQHFMIYLNDEQTNGSVFQEFNGSAENDQLIEYQRFMVEIGEQINQYHQLLSQSQNADESKQYFEELDKIDDQIRAYRTRVTRESPKSTLGMMLAAIAEPKLPEHLRNPQNKKDSLSARAFMSNHFWDGTNFWDGRLANTPFLSDKLDRYFSEVLIPQPDTVIREIDHILANAVADSMLYRLILRKVVHGSKDHYFKWDDAVFIHLYEKYLAAEPVHWLADEEREAINKHAFFLMGTGRGASAPEISLAGLDKELTSLHDLEAAYTIVAFWDPTCDHCKVILPQLDSLYRNEWKEQGLEVFAVGVESDATEKEWRSIIADKQLTAWTHVYNSRADMMARAQANQQLITKSFDVWYFPTFFLLDKDKKFMARKLSFKKMSALINTILEKPKK